MRPGRRGAHLQLFPSEKIVPNKKPWGRGRNLTRKKPFLDIHPTPPPPRTSKIPTKIKLEITPKKLCWEEEANLPLLIHSIERLIQRYYI